MTRLLSMTTMIGALALCSGAWLGLVAPAQAATVTDTFDVQMTGKRWCEGNPKFSENFTVKIDPKSPATNTTLTLTRDDATFADLQATLNTQGGSPDLDAITLNGQASPRNKSGRTAELVLSGTNPSNHDHFLTLRGQATVDKFGHLTTVTGTYLLQETNTYTTDPKTGAQSGPVACFNSGTFVTRGGALVTGTFIDRPVDGLRYTTTSNPVGGVTSGGGHFLCHLGETVTFFLGTRQLGQGQPCSTTPITVVSVLGATSLTDPQVVNLAQLLMTLDSQVNPTVITIPTPLPAGFTSTLVPLFTDPNFDTTVLAALPANTILVTEVAALTQLHAALKQLTVTGATHVTVTSSPAGIHCIDGARACSLIVPTGTVVTLTATGTGFTGWSGGGCSGFGTCVLTLNADTPVTPSVGTTSGSARYHFFYKADGPLMAVDPAAAGATPATVADVVSKSDVVSVATWDAATTSFSNIQPVFQVYNSNGKLWRVHVATSSGVPGSVSNPPIQISNESAATQVCQFVAALDVTNPNTKRLFYELPGADGHCAFDGQVGTNADNITKFVSLADSSTVAPTVLATGFSLSTLGAQFVYNLSTGIAAHMFLIDAANNNTLSTMNLSTKAITPIQANVGDIYGTLQDTSDRVFIVQSGAPKTLYLYTVSSNTLVPLLTGVFSNGPAASDGAHFFVLNTTAGIVYRIPLSATAAGDVTPILNVGGQAGFYQVTANRVYVIVPVTFSGSIGSKIISVPKSGGASREDVPAVQGQFIQSYLTNDLFYYTSFTISSLSPHIVLNPTTVALNDTGTPVASFANTGVTGFIFSSAPINIRGGVRTISKVLVSTFVGGLLNGGTMTAVDAATGAPTTALGIVTSTVPNQTFLFFLNEKFGTGALGAGSFDVGSGGWPMFFLDSATPNSLVQIPVAPDFWRRSL